MDKIMTTTEAAERLGVSAPRVRQMVLRGQLPSAKFGRDLMIKESDLKLVEDRQPGRPPKPKTETKPGTIESQTKTTRRLDSSIKRDADQQMAGKKKGGKR